MRKGVKKKVKKSLAKKRNSPAKLKKKTTTKTMTLIPQPGGRGFLNPGGTPGNKGGTGRPPSKIREAARLAFAERLGVLTDIADGKDTRDADRIAAMKVLADTGGVDKIALTVDEQPETEWTPERTAELWERIQRIRTIEQLERLLVAAAEKQVGK